MTLKDLKIGETGIISSLKNNTPILSRLLAMGFTPNTLVKLKKIAPLGDPIQIQIRNYEIILRKEDAKTIHIIKESK